MLRIRALVIPSLLCAAACAACSSQSTNGGPDDPGDPGNPGGASGSGGSGAAGSGPGAVIGTNDQLATGLGVAVLASDAAGAPRLIRAIVPRTPSVASMLPAAAAQDHVAALAPLWIGQGHPMALAENGTQVLRNGATIVRLQQHIDGIPVDHAELRVLVHADGSFAAAAGTLLAASGKPSFQGSSVQALGHALDKHFGAARPQAAIASAGPSSPQTGGWESLQVAPAAGMKIDTARARQTLANIGGVLVPAWEVEVQGDAAPDPNVDPSFPTFSSHSYLIADKTGAVLRDNDLVQHDAFVYRTYMETTGNRRPLDGPLQDFSPHPTGKPDGSTPALVSSNLVVQEAFNGPNDPWLATNATTTSGNNAESFADLDADRVFDNADVRPVVRSSRVLDYTYDHTMGPTDAPTQSEAAAVNAFFMVNWLHDWWYDSGFTEATGNAQANNFGRGGVAGDPLLVTSQAGANTGLRNNADMSTPADGARPLMRMFLWTAGTVTGLSGPTGTPRTEAFAAGPRTFDLFGDLVEVTDGTAPANDACQPITNAVAGKIVLVTFSGVCGSAATVNNAKAAGAIGILLADGASDDPRAFAGSAAANIPGLAIGKTDGLALHNALVAGPVSIELTSASSGPERDGDLDNGVVAHEWGHYLHHRLTICGTQQCGGMSEGWGDFDALMMMARDGDNRDGTYAEGIYALSDGTPDVGYFGIRRFPYSRDRTKNDLSFRHIADENPLPTATPGHPGGANSEVHNTGEVWASMMWEAFNVLADAHGVTVARRRMADYVVAGMLLTPPEATFTEQRDAILAGASALDSDDMILMAAAFAGRGAGSCAVSPPVTSATNSPVVESGTLAGKLAVGGLSLIDDGISCDHDGFLDPGETGNLHLTLANNGILAAESITVTASTTSAGIKLGAPIAIAALQPFSNAALSIPVTVLPTAPRNTIVTIKLHVTGTSTCDRNGIDATISVKTGVDDVLNASNIDHAETRATPWQPTGDSIAAQVWGHAIESTGNQLYFGADTGFPSDTQFTSPALIASTTQPFVLKFSHAYSLEASGGDLFDGGVIEVSLDGGATWSDVTAFGVNPGYTGALFVGSDNPIAGRQAYSGVSAGYPARVPVTLNFGAAFAGQTVMVRFRIGTDDAASQIGWSIDDIEVDGITNTPFPVQIPEPSTCTAHGSEPTSSSLLAMRSAPSTSLLGFDRGVCILNDAQ